MEVKFIANVIDQLDFALDHILLEDANYKRLSLMLVDNALELALHRHAVQRERDREWKKKNDAATKLIEEAQGQHFEPKVKLAKADGWLPELGMYYYKARMYSPLLGRFMQTDPIGYGDGMNMYAYVANDPVNFSDSSGLGLECTFSWTNTPGSQTTIIPEDEDSEGSTSGSPNGAIQYRKVGTLGHM
jgi:RHS repeat-associated protein